MENPAYRAVGLSSGRFTPVASLSNADIILGHPAATNLISFPPLVTH